MSRRPLPLSPGLAVLCAAFVLTTASAVVEPRTRSDASAHETQPPRSASSLRFAVLGDVGTGSRAQYDVGAQVARSLDTFPFELVLLA